MRFLSLFFACLLPFCTASADQQRTTAQTTTLSTTTPEASRWGLSDSEWHRYTTLMAGPRGLWSPGIDPLTVLGIHAQSDAERRRYAEMLARQEHDRVLQEIAFDSAYYQAWDRLYPNAKVIADPSPIDVSKRVLFFTSTSCAVCDALIPRVISTSRTTRVDIFITGAGDDQAIRAWAERVQIPVELVRDHRITLNHAGDLLAQLSSDDPIVATVPRLYAESAGRFQRIQPEQLR